MTSPNPLGIHLHHLCWGQSQDQEKLIKLKVLKGTENENKFEVGAKIKSHGIYTNNDILCVCCVSMKHRKHYIVY